MSECNLEVPGSSPSCRMLKLFNTAPSSNPLVMFNLDNLFVLHYFNGVVVN